MPDWNTRLEVRLVDTNELITPIDNFTPTFNVPHTVIHSIESDNVGYVRQPMTFTFTMTVKAIGTAVANLTELALNGKKFSICVSEKQGDQWSFSKATLMECIINSANPGTVVIDGVPTASFNCMALDVSLET